MTNVSQGDLNTSSPGRQANVTERQSPNVGSLWDDENWTSCDKWKDLWKQRWRKTARDDSSQPFIVGGGGGSCQRMNRYRCEEWSTVIDKAYRQGTWWLWWRILQMYQEILWVGIFNVTWLYCNVQYSPCGSCTRNVQASRHQSFHLLPHLRDRCQFPPHYLLSSLRTPF